MIFNEQSPFTPKALPLTISAIVAAQLWFPNIAQGEELLPQMVITASRTQEHYSEVPETISSASQAQLKLDQGGHIQDSTRQMAGVTINQLSGSSSHNTAIRMPINYDGYYLFLQDSVPLQSAAFFNHNGLRWSSYNTSADQIEVMKGAGTTLYGSGAVAATINVLSNQPTTEPQGQLSVQAGANDFGQVRAQYSTAINDQQSFLIAGSLLQDNGWREHTARERGELLVKHRWLIDEKNELNSQLQLSRHKDEMASSLTGDQFNDTPELSGLSDEVLATDPVRDSDFIRLSSEWTHFASDQLELSVIPYLRQNTNDYTATWRSYTPKSDSTVNTAGALMKGIYSFDNGNELLFGMDLEHSESDLFSYQPLEVTVSSWGGGSTTYTKGFIYRDQTIRYQNASPYTQFNWLTTEQLQIQAGLRYDYNRFELANNLTATDDDGYGNRQLADRSDSFNSLSPKLGFTWQLDQQSSVYGRLARSNRLPTGSALYNLKSGDSASLVGGVSEETSTTSELGYRSYHNDLTLNLALYRMDIDDAIVSADDSNGDSYRTNAGQVRNEGIELELDYRLSPAFSASLAWSLSKHHYIDYINDGTDFSGKSQALAPNNKGGLTLNWTPDSNTQLQLAVDHFGSYWMDDANTRRGDSYTLTHLKGRYQLAPDLTLYGRIENLFDRQYAYQSEISWGNAKFYPGTPRSLKAGIEYSW